MGFTLEEQEGRLLGVEVATVGPDEVDRPFEMDPVDDDPDLVAIPDAPDRAGRAP